MLFFIHRSPLAHGGSEEQRLGTLTLLLIKGWGINLSRDSGERIAPLSR